MAIIQDMMRTWRAPSQVVGARLSEGVREDRALATLMAACFIIFIGQWPRLSRIAAGYDVPVGAEELDLTQLFTYSFMGIMLIWPLFFYILGGLSHIIAKLLGGKGSFYTARFALFWSLLSTAPMALLHGLMYGFNGPGSGPNLVGAIWGIVFLLIWIKCLIEAEKG